MTGPAVYARKDLMALLGYRDRDAFRRRLRELTAGAYFPSPLPGLPGRWSRLEVDAWLAGVRPAGRDRAPDRATDREAEAAEGGGRATILQSRLAGARFRLIEGGLAPARQARDS
jgi:hypothetical protein